MLTNEDLKWHIVEEVHTKEAQEAIPQILNKGACEFCELEPTEKIYAYGMKFNKIPVSYCPNCGRRILGEGVK